MFETTAYKRNGSATGVALCLRDLTPTGFINVEYRRRSPENRHKMAGFCGDILTDA